ncbi:RodZ domain-containing protein [Streptomyces sparsogenes]|uniref:RodZ domain-containing protein n=1 Tax=Streptomyces sparsogenes TaxID=67365 RepID=UPI003320C90F
MNTHLDDGRPEIPGHILGELLGSGGMGQVYLGRSLTGRRVAIKVIRPEFARDADFRERFRQEVGAARRVSGAFTAPVVDADPDGNPPWMATAYLPGPSLAERVRQGPPLEPSELREVAAGLAEALRDIHRAGLVHRDLKPSNILLTDDGPRVIDFGIARAAAGSLRTRTGLTVGTPPFMSPEQVRGGADIGGASDVFSFGSVMVFTATGHGPFDAEDSFAAAYRVVHEEPDLAGTPDWLRRIVLRCLAKDPARRPTPTELLTELATPPPPDDHVTPRTPADAPAGTPGDASGNASGPASRPAWDEITHTSVHTPHPAPTPTVVDRPATGRSPRTRATWLAVAAAALATAAALGAFYLTGRDDHSTGATPETSKATTSAPATSPTPSATPSSTTPSPDTSSPPPPDLPADRVTVELTAVGGASFVEAKDSHDRTLYQDVLADGDSRTFQDRTKVTLVIGNAGHVRLTVNGKSLGTPGEPGQVQRLVFTPEDGA